MIELYVFIAAVLSALVIIWRRDFIVERLRKRQFKKEVASKVDALREEGRFSPERRFRDSLMEEGEKKKFDIVTYKNCLRQADMAIAKQQWKKAKSFLIQALAVAKDEVPASLKLATVYLRNGDLNRAESLYGRLAEMDLKIPEIYEDLAIINTQKKRYKKAISYYVKAIELNDKNDQWLVRLGRLYALLMRPGLAAECFRRAAELKPREVEHLFLLAEACAADEDFDNAFYTYQHILTLEPYNEKALQASREVRTKMKETELLISTITTQEPKKTAVKL